MKIKHRVSPAAVLSVVILLTGCSRNYGIERGYSSHPGGMALTAEDGTHVVRSLFADVRAEYLDDARFHNLLKNRIFIIEENSSQVYRIPKFIYFQVTVTNRGAEPVRIESIELVADEVNLKAMTVEDIKKQTRSPVYSRLNMDAIFSPGILYTDQYGVSGVNYDKDSAAYRFDFIASGDTVFRIAAFEWLPVRYRNPVLRVKVSSSGLVRPIEFHFKRDEYRTKGKDFTNKQR